MHVGGRVRLPRSPAVRTAGDAIGHAVDPPLADPLKHVQTCVAELRADWSVTSDGRADEPRVLDVGGASAASALAHEALAGGAHERDRFGKEHTHRVAQRQRLLVRPTLHVYLRQRCCRQLHCGVQRERRELLALRLLNRLGLLLGELAQPAQEILGIALERKTKTTFHTPSIGKKGWALTPKGLRGLNSSGSDPAAKVATWRNGQASSFQARRRSGIGRGWTRRTC